MDEKPVKGKELEDALDYLRSTIYGPYDDEALKAMTASEGARTLPHPPDEALKFDDQKLPLDLFPPEALAAITKVLQFGAKKYDRHNWRKGMAWSRVFAALQRHLWEFWGGIDNDEETGLPHLAHAGCCLVFLLTYLHTGTGEDDRYRPPTISDGPSTPKTDRTV